MRRAAFAIAATALVACAAVLDYDDFDTASPRPNAAEAGPDAATSPFSIHVASDTIRATTGVPTTVHVTIERRVPLDTPILFALTGADAIAVPSAPASTDSAELTIVAGDRHGLQHVTLSATTSAYPSYASTAPLTIDVRGAPGAFDTSFGTGGVVVTNLSGFAADVQTLPDAGVIAAFYTSLSGTPGLSLARLRSDGTLDPTFADAGVVNHPGGNAGTVHGARAYVVIRPDARLVAAWEVNDDIWVAGFLADGRPDPTFPDEDVGTDYVADLEATGDGGLLLSGSFQTRRLLADGGLDPSYGDGGIAATGIQPNASVGVTAFDDGSRAVMTVGAQSGLDTRTIDPNGGVGDPFQLAIKCNPRARQLRASDGRWYVLVGCNPSPFPTTFMLARLAPDGGPSPAFGPSKSAVQPPGAIVLVDGGIVHAASGGDLPASVTEYLDDGGTAWSTSLAGKLDSLDVGGVVVDGDRLIVFGDFGTSNALAIARLWL